MSDPKPSFAPADLVASLRRTAGELASMVAELPAGEVTESRGTDWSAAEVIAHLAHFEVLAGARIRMVLTLDRPPLASFDQEEFNRRFADLLRLDTALALFQVNRGVNCICSAYWWPPIGVTSGFTPFAARRLWHVRWKCWPATTANTWTSCAGRSPPSSSC